MSTNPYLEGPFAPVREEVTEHHLPVTGRIPPELNGRYFRNGPNPAIVADPHRHHWMSGEGMIHGVRLREGRAEWYRNRWVRSGAVADRLGEPRRGAPVAADLDFAANTHVVSHAGRILALIEAGATIYELTHDLETVGVFDFLGTRQEGFTAHPKLDPRTGELHAVAYVGGLDHVQYLVVDPSGAVARTTNLPVAGASLMHDFALTEDHVVIYDHSVRYRMEAISRGELTPFFWDDAHPARVGLLPRRGGEIRWMELPPCYVSHTMNAYDEGGRVIVDLMRYAGPFDANAHAAPPPSLERWTLDPVAGTVRSHPLDARIQEFPRVNERFVSRPYRYGYTVCCGPMIGAMTPGGSSAPVEATTNALIKHDFERGVTVTREFGLHAAASEPVFVPRADATDEDDGYLLAFVHHPERDAADLVILAAQDLTGEPLARIHLPSRVPLGFHGSWVMDDPDLRPT
ncbi:carotenoid oxygenase family protein [Chondromyces crocatus]|uniref:Dioxygenase n=1 Tax=Chondromyces crocatus TaxID=52 RepID=A0A0K1EIL7_CHOCO|nr:carotenoid oxygenase family protein [Chondromyces crocatus]AKT40706.1 dioxygenase [Chondromyces crocatus]